MDVHEVLAVVVSSRHDKPREVTSPTTVFANQPASPMSIPQAEAPSPQASSLMSRMGSMFSNSSLSRNSTMGRQSSLNSQYYSDFAAFCDNASSGHLSGAPGTPPMGVPKLARNSTSSGINRGLADLELMFQMDSLQTRHSE